MMKTGLHKRKAWRIGVGNDSHIINGILYTFCMHAVFDPLAMFLFAYAPYSIIWCQRSIFGIGIPGLLVVLSVLIIIWTMCLSLQILCCRRKRGQIIGLTILTTSSCIILANAICIKGLVGWSRSEIIKDIEGIETGASNGTYIDWLQVPYYKKVVDNL